jgi:hypothetical protein
MDDDSRFKVLCAGRRWGKTELVSMMICVAVLKGKSVAYYSMTYKQMDETFKKVLEWMKPVIVNQNLARTSFVALGGGKLICWSGEASATTRGAGYDLFIIDEASFIPNLWDKFTGDILPTLADRQGKAIICSTPKGFNDFHRLYQLGVDGNEGWKSYRYPTRTSPNVKSDELEQLRRVMPDLKFREEFEAEFVSSDGAVFRDVKSVIYDAPQPYKPNRAVMGIDWGRMNDFTAVSIWDADKKCEIKLDRFNKQNWSLQLARVKALVDEYGVSLILAEANSIGQPQIESLVAEGLPVKAFNTTAQSKPAIIESLAIAIEKQEIRLVDDEIANTELVSFTGVQTPSGVMRYSAPVGAHDDTVMARAIGYKACFDIDSKKALVFASNPFMKR